MTEHRVRTPDGRTLQVLEDGDPGGRPVLIHNGTPNSRLLYPPDVRRARKRGIRAISYDRPGYGGSTAQPGRCVADCAVDVRAIAEALGLSRLLVWGVSGGGPHAIACATLLGDLVPAVGVIASLAPWGAEGLDPFEGMGEMNVEDTKLLLGDRDAARAKCERDRLDMLALTVEDYATYLHTLLSPVDRAALTPELTGYLVEATRVGLAPGAEGWWEDGVAFVSSWGLDLASIRTPVLLLHGREDRFVPFGQGQWLAGRIPGVEAWLSDDDGHLSLLAHRLDAMYDWLLEWF